jgi:hypothetical protein
LLEILCSKKISKKKTSSPQSLIKLRTMFAGEEAANRNFNRFDQGAPCRIKTNLFHHGEHFVLLCSLSLAKTVGFHFIVGLPLLANDATGDRAFLAGLADVVGDGNLLSCAGAVVSELV